MTQNIFNRTERLLGADLMQRISSARVIVFGVGGVGSWCCESLIRTGIQHITIVDFDLVGETNVNRQAMATSQTIGHVKVEAMRERLLAINPDADVQAIRSVYNEETAADFDLDAYDYVIDAIDSLKDKLLLIERATASTATLFSSMGAALKSDPTQIRVAEFWKVRGCPLGAALRKSFKRKNRRPARKFKCVYSEELLDNRGNAIDDGLGTGVINKVQVNGSLAHVTAPFGFTLASLVINDLCADSEPAEQGKPGE